MSELIQKLSDTLTKKLREVVRPDEKVYFCIEGVTGNALVGTDKKLVVMTAGSFRGSIIYTYSYDNILDLIINPPLHGNYITLNIIAAHEEKELKPKLYFEPSHKGILKEVLSKISGLSNTYTYNDPIQEAAIHKTDVKLIVPMKNILAEIYNETVKSSETVIICVSIGENQGLVVTDKRVLIYKVNEGNNSYKAGSFPYSDIVSVDYSVGIVTGHLQILTENVEPAKKGLREQDLIDIDNVVCFGKKNYGSLMEVVTKKLREIIHDNQTNAHPNMSGHVDFQTIQHIQKDKKKAKDLKNTRERPAARKTNVKPRLSMEEIADKLSKDIISEIYSDKQTFEYTVEILEQITYEVVKHSFPEMINTELVGITVKRIIATLPEQKIEAEIEFYKDITEDFEDTDFQNMYSEPRAEEFLDVKKDKDKVEEELSRGAIEEKLMEITSLKNIGAAFVVDRKSGSSVCKSIVEEGLNYDRSCKIANTYLKFLKEQKVFSSKTPPQWLVEYKKGLVYLDRLSKKYFLLIIGTENSNFGTLKIFIERTKKELQSIIN